MARIVVGVDGSDAARRALLWAVEEARLRQARLLAVHAWTLPVLPAPMGAYVAPPPAAELRSEAERVLAEAVSDLGEAAEGVDIERQVLEMPPARALLRTAAGADLLVVGSRGLGGFRGLLLGSVGQQVAQHAACPVVIVPYEESDDASGDED